MALTQKTSEKSGRSMDRLIGLVIASFLAKRLRLGRTDSAAAEATASNQGEFVQARAPAALVQKSGAKRGTLSKIAMNVVTRIGNDNLTLVAAGVAFYAMTAIFPAIAAFVSVYGLFADPTTIQQQIAEYPGLLPGASLKLLTDALQGFASKNRSTLNAAFVISVVFALWSAKAGIQALMTGLNIANEEVEKRGFIMQQVVAMTLTIGAIIFAMVALTAVALLPVAINLLPMNDGMRALLNLGRWPMLATLMCFALAVVYRFAPCRRQPKWRWITWGAAIGTILWIVSSILFSFYVSRFGSYNVTYGALAAPVILLLWFWISALVVLVGAEIDAELQHGDGEVARPAPMSAP
jgi:membrane protein